jgi:serine-type D-Ala-D-Ala carboxypeptidase/endopeptidase (penicillin-binding protein 4)
MKYRLYLLAAVVMTVASCSSSKRIAKSARKNLLNDEALESAHVGISIYEPATGKYWYNYQGDKYFVPASNTKLPTCYAAMKYLGDSLVGLRYKVGEWDDGVRKETALLVQPTGDPTFLHPDFKSQRAYEFLKSSPYAIRFLSPVFGHNYYGKGWAWDETEESYMPPLSFFPIYGNLARFEFSNGNLSRVVPSYFEKNNAVFFAGTGEAPNATRFLNRNIYEITQTAKGTGKSTRFEIPFVLVEDAIPESLIADTLHKRVGKAFSDILLHRPHLDDSEIFKIKYPDVKIIHSQPTDSLLKPMMQYPDLKIIHSQPTDSLLKPMMHRSDNFFAEQSLLMVSNEFLGEMNDSKIIDTLLKTDFKNLPQKPRWVDGSGLSRYNLFTPQDFVFILNMMKSDFGMDRIRTILPTGNEGTLEGRFVADSNYIFAKTGTLSGVVSLSGFLYTQKNKLLIFSVLVNNHNASASAIRKAVERFIDGIRKEY